MTTLGPFLGIDTSQTLILPFYPSLPSDIGEIVVRRLSNANWHMVHEVASVGLATPSLPQTFPISDGEKWGFVGNRSLCRKSKNRPRMSFWSGF